MGSSCRLVYARQNEMSNAIIIGSLAHLFAHSRGPAEELWTSRSSPKPQTRNNCSIYTRRSLLVLWGALLK